MKTTTLAPLNHEQTEELYWANFYQEIQHTTPSTFAKFILSRSDTPQFIIDIGCGSGRDSFAFAQQKCKTIGIDRSEVGVRHAAKHALQQNLNHLLEFITVNIANKEQLITALRQIKSKANGAPVMFYMRFFLHSITAEAQEQLMKTIADLATNGDILAVEFRTDKDENNEKVHGGHYRRYQNANVFKQALEEKYNFKILFETEEKGLSPYNGEDPVLYRAIAKYKPHCSMAT